MSKGRGEAESALVPDLAAALGSGLDHSDHGQARAFAGEAAAGLEPVDIMADPMTAPFDPPVVAIDRFKDLAAGKVRRIGEEGLVSQTMR